LGRDNNNYPFGKLFNFIKFIKAISSIAFNGYDSKDFKIELSCFDKVCLALERMEQSEGFNSLQQKTAKTVTIKTSHIVPPDVIEGVKQEIIAKKEEKRNANKNTIYSLDFKFQDYIIENYGNELSMIFKYYCSFGEPMNTSNMKSNKFAKFLKEAKLIKQNEKNHGVRINEIDTIFFKLANNSNFNNLNTSYVTHFSNNIMKDKQTVNSCAKLNYINFINAIELISAQSKGDSKTNIESMVKNNIIPLIRKFITKASELSITHVEDADFVKLKKVFAKSIFPLFKLYSKMDSINFDKIFRYFLLKLDFVQIFRFFQI
jgi:hypothetical protein